MDENALQALLDKQQISELVGPRYARALDWLDIDTLRTCFHPDADVDYGTYKGPAAQWCDMIIASLEKTVHRFHYILNTTIQLDGDKAEVESNCFAGIRKNIPDKPESQDEFRYFGSRYIDQLERRGNAWKLSNRIVRLDFMQTASADAQPSGNLQGLAFLTEANTRHPLYRRLHDPAR
jgi:hypothetical protein